MHVTPKIMVRCREFQVKSKYSKIQILLVMLVFVPEIFDFTPETPLLMSNQNFGEGPLATPTYIMSA
jgi:hypothetical protein